MLFAFTTKLEFVVYNKTTTCLSETNPREKRAWNWIPANKHTVIADIDVTYCYDSDCVGM